MKTRLERALAAAALPLALPVVLALQACGAAEPAETPAAEAVETAEATRRTLDVTAEAAGTLQPILVVEVKSKASGEVLALRAETGDEVRRGTLLAEIDPRDVRNAYAQAEADLEVARVRLQTAAEQRKRAEELRKSNVITEQEFEAARLEQANARAQLVKAETNLQLARQRLGDVTIGAPLDGTIIEKSVEPGQIIASATGNVSGGTTLFRMANLATMQVRALVDETDIGRVQPGQTARVSVEAFPGRTFVGQVYKIEPQAVVEQNVTMFPVLVRLDNGERLLKPGMNAEVTVQVARRENVVVIPNDAVIGRADARSVGAALGLTEDAVDQALERSRGALASGGPGGEGGASANGASAGGARTAAPAAATGDAGKAAPSAADAKACGELRDKIRSGGFAGLSEADRTQLRKCRPQGSADGGAGGGAGGPGFSGFSGFGGPGGPAGRSGRASMRPGVVFVATDAGPEPRSVLLGINDWDYTEVVRGIEPGEKVLVAASLRLKQQQQEFQDRMRERSGANMFGAPTTSTSTTGSPGGPGGPPGGGRP